MSKKTPLRDKKKVIKKISKLLKKKLAKEKEPIADKGFFERLIKKASRKVVKSDAGTLASPNVGD